jgi:hypothetical protein
VKKFAGLVVIVALLALVAYMRTAPVYVIEGTVRTYLGPEQLSVVNEQTDPDGARFVLRETRYEGQGPVVAGARVRVWYRMVGEALPVADRVLVLPSP